MQIVVTIDEIKGGFLIGGSAKGESDEPKQLDRAVAATEKQIPARIKDVIAPLFGGEAE